jgi:hypothetical protein
MRHAAASAGKAGATARGVSDGERAWIARGRAQLRTAVRVAPRLLTRRRMNPHKHLTQITLLFNASLIASLIGGCVASDEPSTAEEAEVAAQTARAAHRHILVYIPNWTPNSRALVYSSGHYRTDGQFDLVTLHQCRPKAEPEVLVSFADDSVYGARYSPDGRQFTFSTFATPGFFLADADGSNVHVVPNTNFDAQSVFSPDGAWIAFVRFVDPTLGPGRVYLIRPDGSDAHPFNDSPIGYTPDWK